jgi:hypothetical protein
MVGWLGGWVNRLVGKCGSGGDLEAILMTLRT